MKIEKLMLIGIALFEGLLLNVFVIQSKMLSDLNLLVWIVFNIWLWVGSPILLMKFCSSDNEEVNRK